MLENKIYQARLDVGFKLEEDIDKINKLCNYISCFFPDLKESINDFALDQPYLFYSSNSENYLQILKKDVIIISF